MAALTNKERQAAFRARKKIQPFADKHFKGMHVATLEQFLGAIKVDREAFLALFPPEPEISEWEYIEVVQYYDHLLQQAIEDFYADPANAETLEEFRSECEKSLAADGFFDGLPGFDWDLKVQMDNRVLSLVDDKVKAEVNEWIASWSDEEREEKHEDYLEMAAYVGSVGDKVFGTQYPLYKLVEAYKKLMALP